MGRSGREADAGLTRVPARYHLLAATWVAGMLTLAALDSARYELALQEDRTIEWWTVTLFLAAGAYGLHSAWRRRSLFDGLVALFCVFVAGEEFSWGQRLLGFTPPATFLEYNKQQEFTLHNFTAIVSEPKWILMVAVAGFGLLLPTLARIPRTARLLERMRITPPPPAAALWFAAVVGLLLWYPVSLTGEWVEALAGSAFLISLVPASDRALSSAAAGLVVAFGLSVFSGRQRGEHSQRIACAQAEAQSILADLVSGEAATMRLGRAASVHKRVWTAATDGYLHFDRLASFRSAICSRVPAAASASRRQHAIDPWGTAYWVALSNTEDGRDVRVYSFGPNRRRDGDRGRATPGSDDVIASASISFDQENQ